jgi:hypothetical protein
MGSPIQAARPSPIVWRAVRSEQSFEGLRQREDIIVLINAGGTPDNCTGFQVSLIRYLTFEYIGVRSEPGELKHLSTRRKGHQTRLRQ